MSTTPLTTLEKILTALAGIFICLLVWSAVRGRAATLDLGKQQQVAAQAVQKAAELQAQKVQADQARDAAKAEADAAKGKAEAALALADARGRDIKTLQAKIAALGPVVPVVNPGVLPQDPKLLAAAFTAEGFQPCLTGPTMGWPVALAPPMLGLIQDGKQYPSALARIDAMGQEITLHEQKETALTVAVGQQSARGDALDTALEASKTGEADCEAVVAQKDIVIQADQEMLKDKDKQKWTWGGVGALAGTIIGILIHLL